MKSTIIAIPQKAIVNMKKNETTSPLHSQLLSQTNNNVARSEIKYILFQFNVFGRETHQFKYEYIIDIMHIYAVFRNQHQSII